MSYSSLMQRGMMQVGCIHALSDFFASTLLVLRRSCRQLTYPLVVIILILVNLIGSYPVPAAPHPQTILPNPQASYTLQQFLRQLVPVHLATTPPLLASGAQTWQGLPQATSTNLPSAEPATMKPASAAPGYRPPV